MISKILVAVDGSAHSMKAVDIAAQIAAGLGASVVLLHVIKQVTVPDAIKEFAKAEHLPEIDADILERGGQHLLSVARDKARSAGVKDVKTELSGGPVARTIVARAKDDGCDMIVLGSRGMGDIEGMLRGGVSHRVEILAKCPVLVVK